jgi:hypothetical protein
VGFKSISQTDIPKDSVVVLTEKQARAVVTDLVRYDACRAINKLNEERINNFKKKEVEFKNQLDVKDSIIYYQKEIIDIQKTIIKTKKPFEIHGYAGVQSIRLTLTEPVIYTNLSVEFTRFNVGAQYFVQAKKPSGYGVYVEYKLF